MKRKTFRPFLIIALFALVAVIIFVILSILHKPAEPTSSAPEPAKSSENVPASTPEPTPVADPDAVYQNPGPSDKLTKRTTEMKIREIAGQKIVYYTIKQFGTTKTDLEDFRTKIKETLNDPRGWTRLGLKFIETTDDQSDVDILLADPNLLDPIENCGYELSCTTWHNQIYLNDDRWREGTKTSQENNFSQRDYQHMVLNHEMGHWLGHYEHTPSCPSGGPAPIMLQQSTGLRGCDSMNAWPLDSELWTDK